MIFNLKEFEAAYIEASDADPSKKDRRVERLMDELSFYYGRDTIEFHTDELLASVRDICKDINYPAPKLVEGWSDGSERRKERKHYHQGGW
jgi:hypothetical protein